jgi:drug/metabolite transporter (DMT)-like permease
MSFSLLALALVVVASLAWSGLDLLRKVLVASLAPLPLLFYLTAGMLPLFAAWVWIDGRFAFAPSYAAPAAASVVLNIIANLAFFRAVRLSPLSLTIPFLSFTPVFAALLAIPIVGEYPSPLQLVGISLVVAGAFLLQSGGEAFSPVAVWRAFRRERGSQLMVLVALVWAATISFDKLGVERSSGPLHGLVLCLGIGVASLGMLAARGRLGELRDARRAPGALAGALVVGAVALGLQLIALQLVWVSLVETLKRGIGNTMAVVFGRVVFAEPVTLVKVLAVLLMALGVGVVMAS